MPDTGFLDVTRGKDEEVITGNCRVASVVRGASVAKKDGQEIDEKLQAGADGAETGQQSRSKRLRNDGDDRGELDSGVVEDGMVEGRQQGGAWRGEE